MAREMKDSGVQWIGEIPVSWNLTQLKRFAVVNNGREVFEETDKTEDAIPVYGSGGVFKYTITPLFEGETVMFGRKGTLGKPIYVNGKLWTVDTMYYLTFSNELSAKFNYYQLTAFDWEPHITHTALPSIVGSEIVSCQLAFPPINEQLQIVSFLDTECARIDAVIEQTRASIDEYKKMKQAVITQAVTKGIRPNRTTKDSGIEWIGAIASNFDLQKLKYVSHILDQFRSPITADQRNQDAEVLYDYYGASGAIDKIDGYTIDDHVMLIGEDGANLRMRNLPLMYEVNGKAWINNHAHILKPKEDTHFYYLFYALEAIDINPYITGSAQPKLSQENLKNIWLPVPSYEEQAEIAEYLQIKIPEIDELISKKNAFVESLESYKRSIIFEYVTGKKEVPA